MDFHGSTILTYHDDPKIVNLLLKAGANPNMKTRSGKTALMTQKDPKTIDSLLKAGADPNIADLSGETALMTQKIQQSSIHC
jgi:ankyrin repeat protein